jgi:TPR repeat protein
LYRQSATRGFAPAQIALGKWNEEKGTPINLTQAYVWYTLASAKGNADAAGLLASVSAKLNDDQLQQAKERAAQWKSRLPD